MNFFFQKHSIAAARPSAEPPKPKVIFFGVFFSAHASLKMPKIMGESLTLFHIEPIELARQLTLLVWDIYEKIQVRMFVQTGSPTLFLQHTEFFGQAWSKPALQPKSPNLM